MTPLPKWVPLLREVLDKNMSESPVHISYALSTVADNVPKVRFVVHRGFLNERRPKEDDKLSENPKNDKDGEPATTASMLSTTDVRTPKADQLRADQWVEICWWLSATQHQFRIKAKGYILPHPNHPTRSAFPDKQLAPPSLPDFDWESERLRIFRKLDNPLRATFCAPIPGTPLKGGAEGGKDIDSSMFVKELPSDQDAKTDEEKKNIKHALENFGLMVFDPVEIDMAALGDTPSSRKKWQKKGDEWIEFSVVP